MVNGGKEVGLLPLGKSEKFAKTIHFFLREVTITGKAENRGDANGMFVPCRLKLTGPKSYIKCEKFR